MLKLHKKKEQGHLMPEKEGISVVGCKEHLEIAKGIADKAITLVKNTKNQLPIKPETHKRIMLYTIDQIGSAVAVSMANTGSLESRVKAKLESVGFEVDTFNPQGGLNGKQLLV